MVIKWIGICSPRKVKSLDEGTAELTETRRVRFNVIVLTW